MKMRTKIVFGIIVTVLLGIYFSIFFQQGIRIDNNFFRKSQKENHISFTGEIKGIKTTIEMYDVDQTSSKVVLKRKNQEQTFQCIYQDASNPYVGILVQTEGKELFKGYYSKREGCMKLRNTEYLPDFDVYMNQQYQYWLGADQICMLALHDYKVEYRGKAIGLILGMIMLLITALFAVCPELTQWRRSKLGNEIDEFVWGEDKILVVPIILGIAAAVCFVVSVADI